MRSAKFWIIVLVASFVASLGALGLRYKIERANDQVALVMDLPEAEELCRERGYPLEEFLREAKSAGVTAFAVSELTLMDAAAEGGVQVFSGSELLGYDRIATSHLPVIRDLISAGELSPLATYLLPNSRASYEALSRELSVRLAPIRIRSFVSGESFLIELPFPREESLGIFVYLPESKAALLKATGLGIVPRLSNYPEVTPSKIGRTLDAVRRIGDINLVIYSGEEVLGFPRYVKETARAMAERGINFGQVEFAKQKGESTLASLMKGHVIRVHSITRGEMEILPPEEVRDRYLRASRERNMRVLYLRPYLVPAADSRLIEHNLEYIRDLRAALVGEGFRIAMPRALPEFTLGRPLLVAIGAGAVAGLLFLAGFFVKVPSGPALAFGLLSLAFYAIMLGTGFALTMRQLVALGVACVFPTLAGAYGLTGSLETGSWEGRGKDGASIIGRAFRIWLVACIVSLIGGFLLAGTLTDESFMVAVRSFMGVKVMHVVPLALVFMLAWHYSNPDRAHRPFSVLAFTRDVLGKPVYFWHLAIIALIGVAGLIYILRTGNVSALPAGAIEEKMRLGLEKMLIVRPRTKEFLLGHPAFLLGATMLCAGERRIGSLLLLAGIIGQISMVNTFSHIHTPIAVTLLRTFWGILLGGIIGSGLSAAYVAARSLLGREKEGRGRP